MTGGCGVPSHGWEHFLDRVPRPRCISNDWRVWGSIPGSGTLLRQCPETPMHFNDWRVWGSIPGLGTHFRQSPETPMHFQRLEGVRFHPRVRNTFWTESQDPNAFPMTGGCGVPSQGPEHLLEGVPRPQCILKDWRVWGSIPGSGTHFRQSPETPTHFKKLAGVGFHLESGSFLRVCPKPQYITMGMRECRMLSQASGHFLKESRDHSAFNPSGALDLCYWH